MHVQVRTYSSIPSASYKGCMAIHIFCSMSGLGSMHSYFLLPVDIYQAYYLPLVDSWRGLKGARKKNEGVPSWVRVDRKSFYSDIICAQMRS